MMEKEGLRRRNDRLILAEIAKSLVLRPAIVRDHVSRRQDLVGGFNNKGSTGHQELVLTLEASSQLVAPDWEQLILEWLYECAGPSQVLDSVTWGLYVSDSISCCFFLWA